MNNIIIDFVDSDWKEIEEETPVVKKPVFQSGEDFLKDYDAYREGNKYKIILSDGSYYYTHRRCNDYLRSMSGEDVQGVVDLEHKLKAVWKVG